MRLVIARRKHVLATVRLATLLASERPFLQVCSIAIRDAPGTELGFTTHETGRA